MIAYIQRDPSGYLFDETYFLMNELFIGFEIRFFNKGEMFNYEFLLGQIIVFTSNLITYEDIKKLCLVIKPKIIVHLSDEIGNRPEYCDLGNLCDLYLRQYNHSHYNYTENSLQIPLGYTNYGFHNIEDFWKMNILEVDSYNSDRKIDWSFIGSMKSDRREMISEMSKIKNNHHGLTENINEVVDIYSNSKFVASGRGSFSLDCFRLYEASQCGSIPIVVGDELELKSSFNFKVFPPWLFCKTWEETRIKCDDILKDDELANKMREDILNWWDFTLKDLRKEIKSVFKF